MFEWSFCFVKRTLEQADFVVNKEKFEQGGKKIEIWLGAQIDFEQDTYDITKVESILNTVENI